jgi:hypothetical protein
MVVVFEMEFVDAPSAGFARVVMDRLEVFLDVS